MLDFNDQKRKKLEFITEEKDLRKTTIRKHFFSIRVINNWNSLPYKIANAVSLDSFKSKLDNAWEDKIYVF